MLLLAYRLIKLLCWREFLWAFFIPLLNSFSVLVIKTPRCCQVEKVALSTAWLDTVTNCRSNLLSHKAQWDLSTHCYWNQYGETRVNNASSTPRPGPAIKLLCKVSPDSGLPTFPAYSSAWIAHISSTTDEKPFENCFIEHNCLWHAACPSQSSNNFYELPQKLASPWFPRQKEPAGFYNWISDHFGK